MRPEKSKQCLQFCMRMLVLLHLSLFVHNCIVMIVKLFAHSAVCWMFVKSQPNLPINMDDNDDEPPLLSDETCKERTDDPIVTTRVQNQVGLMVNPKKHRSSGEPLTLCAM